MDIKDLNDGAFGVDCRGDIVQLDEESEIRIFIDKHGNQHRVREAILKDFSGFITLTLWDDQIEQVKLGSYVVIFNGYVKEFKGVKNLGVGRYGRLVVNGP